MAEGRAKTHKARDEGRMMKDEMAGKATQSQVHGWYKPGESHVLGRELGGASQVHAWYMRHQSHLKTKEEG